MGRCLVSFGANLGDARGTIDQAQKALREAVQSSAFYLSRLYNTPPVGGPVGQPPFLNCVAAFETSLSPWEVWGVVRNIESELGRERFKRWEARRIDVDILLYDELRIWTPQLKIPHPRLCMRRFILEPAAEVAAEWCDPVSRLTIGALAKRLRSGRANLVLCAASEHRPVWLLEQVARQAAAGWIELEQGPKVAAFGVSAVPFTAREPAVPHTRYVSAIAMDDVAGGDQPLVVHPEPKLLVCYVAASTEHGGQWEDKHRGLARRLGLVPGADQCSSERLTSSIQPLCQTGARYLLVTDDSSWAVHELVAALDAMDCPVEPIASE